VNRDDSLRALDLPEEITRRWFVQLAEPQRHYHTLVHVERMLEHVLPTDASREMIAAIWLHDIVYDPRASDNEERSAQQAAHDLADSGIDIPTVAGLILGTRLHEAGTDPQNILNDLDLGIFGAPADAYDRYARQIRAEYAFVEEAAYRAGRARILRRFDEQQIYRTVTYGGLEAQAHANLKREIEGLER
jgi:predicted metal-dependent HD superfamily phosphohydrolase